MYDDDSNLPADDGTFDSNTTVVLLGVLAPLAMVGLATFAIWNGGVVLNYKGAVVHYRGFNAVASAVDFLLGIGLIFVAKFLLPNVFRRSYRYQYFAILGVVMVGTGLIWFLVAAFV